MRPRALLALLLAACSSSTADQPTTPPTTEPAAPADPMAETKALCMQGNHTSCAILMREPDLFAGVTARLSAGDGVARQILEHACEGAHRESCEAVDAADVEAREAAMDAERESQAKDEKSAEMYDQMLINDSEVAALAEGMTEDEAKETLGRLGNPVATCDDLEPTVINGTVYDSITCKNPDGALVLLTFQDGILKTIAAHGTFPPKGKMFVNVGGKRIVFPQ